MKAKVLIVMGSDSDLSVMEGTAKILNEFNIFDPIADCKYEAS